MLIYGERIVRGMLAGKKVCAGGCAKTIIAKATRRMRNRRLENDIMKPLRECVSRGKARS